MLITSALKILEQDRGILLDRLSIRAVEFYKQAGNDESKKQAIVQNWIFATFRPHRPSPQDLQEVLQRLPAHVRDRVENLPPEQLKAELTRRFYDYRRWYPEGKRPGFPGNPPADRPGGESRKGSPQKSPQPDESKRKAN
jgi:hypothetical protein